jgi:hypothetical protein
MKISLHRVLVDMRCSCVCLFIVLICLASISASLFLSRPERDIDNSVLRAEADVPHSIGGFIHRNGFLWEGLTARLYVWLFKHTSRPLAQPGQLRLSKRSSVYNGLADHANQRLNGPDPERMTEEFYQWTTCLDDKV